MGKKPIFEERRTTCNIVQGVEGTRIELRTDLRSASEVARIINILRDLGQHAFDEEILFRADPVKEEEPGQEDDEGEEAEHLGNGHDADGVELVQ